MDDEDIKINEAITLIARETGWSIEYIRNLPSPDFDILLKEIRYQKAVEEWRALRGIGLALSTWANSFPGKPRSYTIEYFIGDEPKRDGGDEWQPLENPRDSN